MSGLLDIAPRRAKVDVDGHELEVGSLTMLDIAELLQRFPSVREAFGSAAQMGAGDLFGLLRDAIAPIIAAGLGKLGDKAHEKAAARLPADLQLELFGAILKLTMPEGAGPFVERVAAALGHLLSKAPSAAVSSGSLPAPSKS